MECLGEALGFSKICIVTQCCESLPDMYELKSFLSAFSNEYLQPLMSALAQDRRTTTADLSTNASMPDASYWLSHCDE